MSVSKSRFTIAKLDAGMAILLTSDHHLIEFPSLLLPHGVKTGSIIDLAVSQNREEEKKVNEKFTALQRQIRDLFAVHPPSTPELSVRNITQTSVVLGWNLLDIATATFRSLTLYKNGQKLGKIPNATTTVTKLSGLALDTDYSFHLVLKTSAGTYKSNILKVRTHKMTDLTGLNVCIANVKDEVRASVAEALERIGAKPPHDKIRIDTTHLVTTNTLGEEYKKAQQTNVPVVLPDFIEACESDGRIVRVGNYYLDSDPSKRPPIRPITSRAPTQTGAAPTDANQEAPAGLAPDHQNGQRGSIASDSGPPRRAAGTQPASAQTQRVESEADEAAKTKEIKGSKEFKKLAGYLNADGDEVDGDGEGETAAQATPSNEVSGAPVSIAEAAPAASSSSTSAAPERPPLTTRQTTIEEVEVEDDEPASAGSASNVAADAAVAPTSAPALEKTASSKSAVEPHASAAKESTDLPATKDAQMADAVEPASRAVAKTEDEKKDKGKAKDEGEEFESVAL